MFRGGLHTFLAVAVVGFVSGCLSLPEQEVSVSELGEFARPANPEGLSGVTRTPDGHYYAVDDRGGRAFELELSFSEDGSEGKCAAVRKLKLKGRVDLEGCAWDPLTGWLWVSDENDTSINAYDLNTCEHRASVEMPEIYKKVRHNCSLEALTISPDGKRMYTANEDTLLGDGDKSSMKEGALVRIQEFVRGDAKSKWCAERQMLYRTDPMRGKAYQGKGLSGVVGMVAEADGSLLVLERELSQKFLVPSFRARLYRICPDTAVSDKIIAKELLWGRDTSFANYEGICRGPALEDGSRTLVLVADGGGPAAETFLVLKCR